MNRLAWIVTIPIAISVVLFAVNNSADVKLNLWPLPWEIQAPLFLFTLGAIVFGFLFGAIAAWGSGGRTRRKVRALQLELAGAKDEIVGLKRSQPARSEVATRESGTPVDSADTRSLPPSRDFPTNR